MRRQLAVPGGLPCATAPWPNLFFSPGLAEALGICCASPAKKQRGETRSGRRRPLSAVSASSSSGGKRRCLLWGSGAAEHPPSPPSSQAWGLPATFLCPRPTLHGEVRVWFSPWEDASHLACSLGRSIAPVQGWGRGAAGDDLETVWPSASAQGRVSRSRWLGAMASWGFAISKDLCHPSPSSEALSFPAWRGSRSLSPWFKDAGAVRGTL